MFRWTPSCTQASHRGRVALLCGVAVFVAAQLGLDVALNTCRPLRDPEYGRRLESLRARLAERSPGRPLVCFLGSSRIACTVQPALLPYARQARGGAGPVVFNYGICRSGPVWELLTLRRLVDDGVRPDCVYVEVWPYQADLSLEPFQLETRFPHERLRWGDLQLLRTYSSAADSGSRRWYKDQVVPCLSLRTWLLNQWAPSWVSPSQRVGATFDGLDGWGWLAVPHLNGEHDPRRALSAEYYVFGCNQFRPSDASRCAFVELLDLCRRERITAVLLATPDPYLPRVAADARRRTDDWLCGLSAENDAPLIDARGWASEEDFFDPIHLTRSGGAAFTERLDREVLRPYFAGEPPARRWPPGRLNAAPAAPDGSNP